jgi:S-layer homology domain/Transglycosylase SLT domain
MKRAFIQIGAAFSLLLVPQAAAHAESSDPVKPAAALDAVKELTTAEIKQRLHEAADRYGIPGEILKAMAYVETGMKQFDENGNPIVTSDGGIGIMQVTLTDEEMRARNIDKEKLLYDTAYNIDIGAQILKEKWNWAGTRIPKINDQNPDIIENWYFAVMAYNGLSKRNDPNLPHDQKTYQDRVFDVIRDHSLVDVKRIPRFQAEYSDENQPDIMYFPVKQYNWPQLDTKTTQHYHAGDKLYTWNSQASYSNIRNGVDGTIILKAPHYTPLEIVGGPYESAANPANHYVFYRVKGNGIDGYVASSNVVKADVKIFSDLSDHEVVSAVTYLYLKNVITGYEDGTFRPNDRLLRRHAAKMLVNELGLELPKGYVPKAKDMKPSDPGYKEMVIAEAYGFMGQDGRLRPNEYLTRAQMASILVRAYRAYYDAPKTQKAFKDVPLHFWNYNDINTLAYNGITVVDTFRPNENVTRGQFVLFLKRTLDKKEEQ